MNTPIRDFVVDYCKRDTVRLHMPGHKGKDFLGFEKFDITEIDGADVLYDAGGIIKESEENASSLFDSYRTFYSCEGSSLCIKAMLAVISTFRRNKNRKTKILAARNVHKAFVYGCALCDIDVDWLYPAEALHLCTCVITPDELEKKLSELDGDVDGVYITSPDYLGRISDIKELSTVCDRYSVPLLVDNAHGAYLRFLEKSAHPINNGAYMCCDSAHKTLPVLTGGAYLHISDKAKFCETYIESMMSIMGSTSPSYLVLQSLDVCNRYISDGYAEKLKRTINMIADLKNELMDSGICVEKTEPLKLVINLKRSGIDIKTMTSALYDADIVAEFYDSDHIVFMFTPENTYSDSIRLSEALLCIKRNKATDNNSSYIFYEEAEKVMSIREAFFSLKETISVENAEGRICSSPAMTCPPAVPPVVSGEIISKAAKDCMLYYGIEKIEVVK